MVTPEEIAVWPDDKLKREFFELEMKDYFTKADKQYRTLLIKELNKRNISTNIFEWEKEAKSNGR